MPDSDDQLGTRLRIHHLLVWIFLTAALLALSRALVTTWSTANSPDVARTALLRAAWFSIIWGGDATVVICLAGWWWRGSLRRIQPGEWLATYGVAIAAASLVPSVVIIFSATSDKALEHRLLDWVQSFVWLTYVPWCVVFVWLAVTSQECKWWRIAYLLLAIDRMPLLITPIIARLASPSGIVWRSYSSSVWYLHFIHVVVLPVICCAAYSDWVQRRDRRWSHWLGILLHVAQVIGFLAAGLWSF